MDLLRITMQRSGIPVTVSEKSGVLELWLIQPDYEAHAMQVLNDFKTNPPPPETMQVRRQTGTLSSLWRMLAQQAGLFTFIVALTVLSVYVMQWFIAPEPTLRALLFTPGGAGPIDWGQPWRLFSPMLLHFSAMHLIFNLFWWWYLGGRIELQFGTYILVAVTFFTAVVSNYAQWAFSGPLFGGLSGVVYGLFGFAIVVAWRKPWSPLALPPALIVFMVGWLLLGFADVLFVNMANEAHLAGLLSGLLFGAIVRTLRLGRKASW
ncbi:rhomboid family intramembrane serine protease [Aliidiomarina sanyensis]|uniref:Rhomboid family intramembrane serine protease n=2 Tax=Aliidiomarina sanyensis TaxID=1249555 RepID=A0A432WQD6_9GAMM|nr:rhomboid family intramembrane serine protease [Aliidiomarina sanyensis]